MGPLLWIGLAFQAAGIVATGFGAAKTWREFATEPFSRPIAERGRRTWAWITYRLLRRPAPVAQGSAELKLQMSATARGYAPFPTIPKNQGVEQSLSELDERTRQLLGRLVKLENRLDDDGEDIRATIGAVRQDLDDTLSALRDSDREVATSGIRLEAFGLALIAVGLVLQGIGSAAM